MTNEQRAKQLIKKYGFHFAKIPKEEIICLLEEEIANYQPGSSEYIRLLCGYLYCLGDCTDVPLLEKAKYSLNMDVGCMIDAEWIESLKNGGIEENHVNARPKVIENFVSYYQDFEADDVEIGANGTESASLTPRKEKNLLPEKISCFLEDKKYQSDSIGMSIASIRIYSSQVLKIQECTEEAKNEYQMLQYLQGRLPVPQIYAYETANGGSFLLMSKCEGQMACDDEYMTNPALQCRLLANGLKQLWSIDISDCPCDQRLIHKLAQAEYNVEHHLVDMDNVEADTFGENGFQNPAALLQWLYEHKPEEELVFSHGDYCLPNLFGIHDQVTGYIDLGRAGIADRWCDIALCYRSLSHNYSGRYHGTVYAGYDDQLLFRELGIEPNWEKIRYYILLDELF